MCIRDRVESLPFMLPLINCWRYSCSTWLYSYEMSSSNSNSAGHRNRSSFRKLSSTAALILVLCTVLFFHLYSLSLRSHIPEWCAQVCCPAVWFDRNFDARAVRKHCTYCERDDQIGSGRISFFCSLHIKSVGSTRWRRLLSVRDNSEHILNVLIIYTCDMFSRYRRATREGSR